MKPRLLDLFCGAGGAAMGYHRAGFDVVGIDINPQPDYPFTFVQGDVLGPWLRSALLSAEAEAGGELGSTWSKWRFAAIHASPPCHANTTLRHRTGRDYVDLIPETRELLETLGLPYVIENVEGARLRNPLRLCGTSFGLGVDGRELRRHRRFETNFPVMAPPCQHTKPVVGVYGTGGGGQMTRGFKARGVKEARVALGIDWMTLAALAQSIPPAYTEHIGGYLMAAINTRQKEAA